MLFLFEVPSFHCEDESLWYLKLQLFTKHEEQRGGAPLWVMTLNLDSRLGRMELVPAAWNGSCTWCCAWFFLFFWTTNCIVPAPQMLLVIEIVFSLLYENLAKNQGEWASSLVFWLWGHVVMCLGVPTLLCSPSLSICPRDPCVSQTQGGGDLAMWRVAVISMFVFFQDPHCPLRVSGEAVRRTHSSWLETGSW